MALALIRIEEHTSDHKHFAKKKPINFSLAKENKNLSP